MTGKNQNDEDDDADEDLTQVEVSHGSTCNQTSMYASTSSTSGSASSTFLCDVLYAVILLSVLVFIILFWGNDHLPHISSHFSGGKNHQEKVVILVVLIVFAVIMLLLFIARCVRRARYSICHRTMEAIWYKRKRQIPRGASVFNDEKSVDDRFASSPSQKNEDCYSKLEDLSELDLRELKRILTIFSNYHDSNDWSFSPTSHSSLLRKATLGRSPSQQKQKVKLKFAAKAVLVGPPNVGKTSVFHRILYDRFTEYYMATLGADLGHNTLHIFPTEQNNHLELSLQLWDIAGSERFSELSHIVYKDATSFVVVCDVTCPSFATATMPWVRDIENLVYEPRVNLLYNKIDLHQKMATMSYMNEELAKFDSYSVSAKTGEGVLESMVLIIARSVLHEIEKLL